MSDLSHELTALRDGAAVLSPARRFLVRASGPDLLPWLERLCSNPVQDMGARGVRRCVLMDGKGKTRCDLRVLAPAAPADGVLLDLPASGHANLLRLLDMFIIKEKVELADQRDVFVHLALVGPEAGAVLAAAGLPAVPPEGELASPRPDLFLLRENLTGTGGVELFAERESARDLVDALLGAGAARAGEQAAEIVRLEQGVPRFDKDFAEGVIPLEAGLDDWVSTTKGCYPGQEVVARIRNLGQVSRKLVRLHGAGALELADGAELQGTGEQQGKPAGTLSSWATDPVGGRTLALAYVRRAFWADGTELSAGDARLRVGPPADG